MTERCRCWWISLTHRESIRKWYQILFPILFKSCEPLCHLLYAEYIWHCSCILTGKTKTQVSPVTLAVKPTSMIKNEAVSLPHNHFCNTSPHDMLSHRCVSLSLCVSNTFVIWIKPRHSLVRWETACLTFPPSAPVWLVKASVGWKHYKANSHILLHHDKSRQPQPRYESAFSGRIYLLLCALAEKASVMLQQKWERIQCAILGCIYTSTVSKAGRSCKGSSSEFITPTTFFCCQRTLALEQKNNRGLAVFHC